jgi:hypothetical protein
MVTARALYFSALPATRNRVAVGLREKGPIRRARLITDSWLSKGQQPRKDIPRRRELEKIGRLSNQSFASPL